MTSSTSGETQPLTIRPATAGDVGIVLRFIRELAEYEKLLHEVVASEAQLERWMFGEEAHVRCEIAEWEGTPVGFALYFFNFSTFLGAPGLYLEDLYVTPDCRGKGIGRALLARLAAIARERDCLRVEWVVLNWNTPSIKFYEGLGAQRMDAWSTFRLAGSDLNALADESPARR